MNKIPVDKWAEPLNWRLGAVSLSPASAFVTDSCISIDGGWVTQ